MTPHSHHGQRALWQSKRHVCESGDMLSYAYPASDVRTLTSNLGDVRMPVLGIPELRTMGCSPTP